MAQLTLATPEFEVPKPCKLPLGHRISNLWSYDPRSLDAFFRRLLVTGDAQIGDVLYPQDGVRGEGLFMVLPDRTLEPLWTDRKNKAFLPPKALAWGLQRGFTVAVLLRAFKIHPAAGIGYVIYPLSMQSEADLKIDRKTDRVQQVRGFDFAAGGEVTMTPATHDLDRLPPSAKLFNCDR